MKPGALPVSVDGVGDAPPMPFAVELHFDDPSRGELASVWSALAEVAGRPRRTELGIAPHVSVAVLPDRPRGLDLAIQSLARSLPAFDLHLDRIDHFPGDEGVVFIGVVPQPDLLQVHEQVNGLLERLGAANLPHYQPGRWRPHCTVATDVPPALLPQVLSAASSLRRPEVVRAVSLCGVGYRPAKLDFTAALGAGSHP